MARFLETQGYAQVKDSATESILADMVCRPVDGAIDARELWVETKATKKSKASLADEDLAREVCDYLAAWLIRRPEARFRFAMFVEEASSPKAWERLFGASAFSDAEEWTSKFARPEHLELIRRDSVATLSFFGEAEVYRASRERLEDAISRRKGADNARVRRYALDALKRLDGRARAPKKNAVMLSNMVPVTLPKLFLEVKTSMKSHEVRDILWPFEAPPAIPAEKGTYVVPSTSEDDELLSALDAYVVAELSPNDLEAFDGDALFEMTNQIVAKVARRAACIFVGEQFIFLGKREISEGKPRKIFTDAGRLQVVKPIYREEDETDDESETPEAATIPKAPNYVHHISFEAFTTRIFDEYHIVIRPHRAFSDDGSRLIRGSRAAALDAHYRKSLYNRSLSYEEKVRKIASYLFPRVRQSSLFDQQPTAAWKKEFRFGDLATMPTSWVPERVGAPDLVPHERLPWEEAA